MPTRPRGVVYGHAGCGANDGYAVYRGGPLGEKRSAGHFEAEKGYRLIIYDKTG